MTYFKPMKKSWLLESEPLPHYAPKHIEPKTEGDTPHQLCCLRPSNQELV